MTGRLSISVILIVALLAVLAAFGFADLPGQLAEANRTYSLTQQGEQLFAMGRPLREAEVAAAVAEAEAEAARNVARIQSQQWQETERARLRVAAESAWQKFGLDLAYGGAGLVGAALLGLTVVWVVRATRQSQADIWDNPLYRRQMREVAQALERLQRARQTSAPAASAKTRSSKNGKTPEPKASPVPEV